MKNTILLRLRRSLGTALLLCTLGLAVSSVHAQTAPPTATRSRVDTIAGPGGNSLGQYVSIKISPTTGQPAMAAYDVTAKKLTFSTFNGTTWSAAAPITDPSGSADYGLYCSLAFSSAGVPSIAYFDQANRSLKYARFNGLAWAVETVDAPEVSDATGRRGEHCSLALAPDGTPYIPYFSTGITLAPTLVRGFFLAKKTGATWTFTSLDSRLASFGASRMGFYNSIAFRPDGQPGISYVDGIRSKLILIEFNPATNSWAQQVGTGFESSIDVANGPTSLAYSATGATAISYSTMAAGVSVASRSDPGIAWTVATGVIPSNPNVATTPPPSAVAFLGNGEIIVAGLEWAGRDFLRGVIPSVAVRDGAAWRRALVADEMPTVLPQQDCDMVLASDGLPLICHSNLGETAYEIAKLTGWSADSSMNTNSANSTSLCYRPDGQPAIAYQNENGLPAYSYRLASGLWSNNVNQSPGVGFFDRAALTLFPDGKPLVSYAKVNGSSIAFAEISNAGTLVSAGEVPFSPSTPTYFSVAFGPRGRPSVGLSNSGFIQFGEKNLAGGWDFDSPFTGTGLTGFLNERSLAYTGLGRAAMAYVGTVGGDASELKFSERLALGGWKTVVVDSIRDVIAVPKYLVDVALAYGPAGQAGICYSVQNGFGLRFAERRADDSWAIAVIDPTASARYNSLAYSPAGQPAITYLDTVLGQQKCAERSVSGTWNVHIVDSTDSMGRFPIFGSLAFAGSGKPTLSYQRGSAGSGQLRFAERFIDTSVAQPPVAFCTQGLVRDPATTEVTLSWLPTAGAIYDVEASLDLTSPWSRLNGPEGITPLCGMTFFKTNSLIGQNPRAFFRVKRR